MRREDNMCTWNSVGRPAAPDFGVALPRGEDRALNAREGVWADHVGHAVQSNPGPVRRDVDVSPRSRVWVAGVSVAGDPEKCRRIEYNLGGCWTQMQP